MLTQRYIILWSVLFFGLFVLPSVLRAEEMLLPKSTSNSIKITGYNVICRDSSTTLTVTVPISFPSHRVVWSTTETTNSITVSPQEDAEFVVTIREINTDTILGTAERLVYVTTRPAATRVNDTLCPGLDREATIGVRNTTAEFFLWYPDPANVCYNDTVIIDNDTIFNVWEPPPTTDSINIWQSVANGKYVERSVFYVQMSAHPIIEEGYENNCYSWDSVFIEIEDVGFDVTPNTSICQGNAITLHITGANVNSIRWSTGKDSVTSVEVYIEEIGDTVFSVEAVDTKGCPAKKEITVTGMIVPKDVSIVIETGTDSDTICRGASAILRVVAGSENAESFLWEHTRETTDSIEIWPSGRFNYSVMAFGDSDRKCYTTANILVSTKNCDIVYFPTAIRLSSPIAANRIFKPIGIQQENTQYYFAIFDRWGQLIFESRDLDIGWNGTHQGENVRPGTFVYVFRLSNRFDTWERTGTVTVVD